MEQEYELTDYSIIHELQGTETHHGGTERSGATPIKRRLLRAGVVTLGVLCIVQAALNISLRLAFFSQEDADQFPFNVSTMADMCQSGRSQQDPTQSCSCCRNLLRRLLREYQALERERDDLRDTATQLAPGRDYFLEVGSGAQEVGSGAQEES